MKTKQAHTPTPYKAVDYAQDGQRISIDGENNTIAEVFDTEGNIQANVAFIVRACNRDDLFENLLKALKEAHQDEIDHKHYGDKKSDCSYCKLITEAEAK